MWFSGVYSDEDDEEEEREESSSDRELSESVDCDRSTSIGSAGGGDGGVY